MQGPTDQEILDILAEECAEVIHIISKIRRFGLNDCHPVTGKINRERLEEELSDLSAMINWSRKRGIHDFILSPEKFTAKVERVRKYYRG